jgi:hypothetical protein
MHKKYSIYMTHARCLATSFARLSTTFTTSSPQKSAGCCRKPLIFPSSVLPVVVTPRHVAVCFSASPNSITTQFSRVKGTSGSHRTRIGRDGTAWGGMTERPRCKSSNMSATSSSSMGSLLLMQFYKVYLTRTYRCRKRT